MRKMASQFILLGSSLIETIWTIDASIIQHPVVLSLYLSLFFLAIPVYSLQIQKCSNAYSNTDEELQHETVQGEQ